MFSSCLTRNILCLLSICSVIGQNVFRNVVFLEWYSWIFLNEACTVWENKVWSEDEIYEIKLRRKKPGKEPGSPPTATENQAKTGDSGDPQQSVHTAPCQGHCSEFPQGWSLFFLLVDWGGGGGVGVGRWGWGLGWWSGNSLYRRTLDQKSTDHVQHWAFNFLSSFPSGSDTPLIVRWFTYMGTAILSSYSSFFTPNSLLSTPTV